MLNGSSSSESEGESCVEGVEDDVGSEGNGELSGSSSSSSSSRLRFLEAEMKQNRKARFSICVNVTKQKTKSKLFGGPEKDHLFVDIIRISLKV